MRIAQVAPLCESVPPERYGGTERVVHYLTEELVARGHHVTLFASGDSHTSAQLIPCVPRALRLHTDFTHSPPIEVVQLERVLQEARRFDLIHFHNGFLHFSASRRMVTPTITTMHGRLDLPELQMLFRAFQSVPLVSISDSQRIPVPYAGWLATVYHGLPRNLYRFNPRPQHYFAFLGRISPEKRLDRAIAIAKATGTPLKIGAKIDRADHDYFTRHIKPLLNDPLITYLGDIDDAAKQDLLCNARALLFPIDWPEPFGLVMIEALACGTPVIAWKKGAAPEVLGLGAPGMLVNSMGEAIAAAEQIDRIDRGACRDYFERRFLASRMAADYERIYERLVTPARRARSLTRV